MNDTRALKGYKKPVASRFRPFEGQARTRKVQTMTNKDVAQKVVDRIVELIEQGQPLPWVKPWNRRPDTVTVVDGVKTITVYPKAWNRKGVPYKGANTYLPSGEYITFKQCKDEGGKVKKGAKSFPVVYWNFTKKEETDPETGETVTKTIPFLKFYTVFRVEDCEGIEQKHDFKDKAVTIEVPITHVEFKDNENCDLNETAEAVIADYVARAGNDFYIECDGLSDEAYYSPVQDYVKVPNRRQFSATEEYYSTLFHELGHSTGHSTRLNRFTGANAVAMFGSESYSREELVAETVASGMLNALGMETGNTFRNSASYIKSWASHIKNDPMMYVTASTRAQSAIDLLLGIDKQTEEEAEE